MWIIFNRWIPIRGFWMLTWWWMIFVRDDTPRGRTIPPAKYRHERRHWHQVCQISVVTAVLYIVSWAIWRYSAWWLLTWCVSYYAVYVLHWIVELALPPYDRAYRDICFETECRYTENDPDYSPHWWSKWWGWVRFISNTKYAA